MSINATKSIKMCPVNLPQIREPFPLHLAAEKGLDKIATILVQHKANVNAQNNHGLTPLFNTTLSGNSLFR